MSGIGTINQNDSLYEKYNECSERVTAMRLRVVGVLEKMNLEEMGLKDLVTYTALLSSVCTLFPFGFGAAACCCESKEE